MRMYFERARCEKSTTDELESLASRLSISESVEEVVHNIWKLYTINVHVPYTGRWSAKYAGDFHLTVAAENKFSCR